MWKQCLNLSLVMGAAVCLAASAAQAQDPEAEAGSDFQTRIRWGIAAAGGPMVGGYSGGGGGIEGRIGAQLSSMLGVYAQPTLLVGVGASADANGASATGLALYGVGALADLTLGDLFYLAAGPELLLGGVGTAAASNNGSSSASASEGPFFAISARAGFALGSVKPTRRSAFTIGINVQSIFAGSVAILPLITLGYERF